MKSTLLGILFTGAIMTGAIVTGPAAAAELPDRPASRAAPCDPGIFCYWSGIGFTGEKHHMADHNPGTCVYFFSARRSYANYGPLEGYFYSTSDCTGSARAVTHHSESPDIGFDAWSFLHACVSCRSEAPQLPATADSR